VGECVLRVRVRVLTSPVPSLGELSQRASYPSLPSYSLAPTTNTSAIHPPRPRRLLSIPARARALPLHTALSLPPLRPATAPLDTRPPAPGRPSAVSAMRFNLFHILGDVSHTCSKLILIWAIHSNSSTEGEWPLTFIPSYPPAPTRHAHLLASC
jgi:hypothetical protein